MSYRVSAKNRRFKRGLLKLISMLRFDGFFLDNSQKTALFGTFLGIVSLFSPWVSFLENSAELNQSVFSKILGITGVLILLILMFNLFLIFQNTNKEVFKNMFALFLKDGVIITFLGLFLLGTATNAIFIIEGLKTFQQGILIGNGPIIAIIGSIFSIIGGYLITKTRVNTTLFGGYENLGDLGELQNNTENKVDEINNMKLPF